MLIVTDDQRFDQIDRMPILQREIVGRGVLFEQALEQAGALAHDDPRFLTAMDLTGALRRAGEWSRALSIAESCIAKCADRDSRFDASLAAADSELALSNYSAALARLERVLDEFTVQPPSGVERAVSRLRWRIGYAQWGLNRLEAAELRLGCDLLELLEHGLGLCLHDDFRFLGIGATHLTGYSLSDAGVAREAGVVVGQRFLVFRDKRHVRVETTGRSKVFESLITQSPLVEIGEALVVSVRANDATVRITSSKTAITTGDLVAPIR